MILELGKQANVSELVSKFFRVLNDASRLELLAHMSKPFEELLLEKNNTVKATVTSVVSLSESDLDSVRVKIEAMVGKKVLETSGRYKYPGRLSCPCRKQYIGFKFKK